MKPSVIAIFFLLFSPSILFCKEIFKVEVMESTQYNSIFVTKFKHLGGVEKYKYSFKIGFLYVDDESLANRDEFKRLESFCRTHRIKLMYDKDGSATFPKQGLLAASGYVEALFIGSNFKVDAIDRYMMGNTDKWTTYFFSRD